MPSLYQYLLFQSILEHVYRTQKVYCRSQGEVIKQICFTLKRTTFTTAHCPETPTAPCDFCLAPFTIQSAFSHYLCITTSAILFPCTSPRCNSREVSLSHLGALPSPALSRLSLCPRSVPILCCSFHSAPLVLFILCAWL